MDYRNTGAHPVRPYSKYQHVGADLVSARWTIETRAHTRCAPTGGSHAHGKGYWDRQYDIPFVVVYNQLSMQPA